MSGVSGAACTCSHAQRRPKLRITVALVDSLLSAIVRADGDALVMHVGERPYVVVGTQSINISTHGLNLEVMSGMLLQVLPGDAQAQLEEFGAVEHKVPQQGDDRFTIVAARGGDDIWIEIRRRRGAAIAEAPVEAAPAADSNAQLEPLATAPAEIPQPESHPEPQPALEPLLTPAPEPAPELQAVRMPVTEPEPRVEPVLIEVVEPELEVATMQVVAPEPHFEPVITPVNDEAEPVVTEVPAPEPVFEPLAAPVFEPLPIAASIEDFELETVQVKSHETERPVVAAAPTLAPVFEPFAEPVADAVAVSRVEMKEPGPTPVAALVDPPGVVSPMTRTVRIEVPPRTSPRAATGIDRLLRHAVSRNASALFLTSDSRPWIRIDGGLRHLDSEPALSRADVEAAILEIAPESGHESIGRGEPAEWIAEFSDVGRIRCTTFSDHRGPGVLLQLIATRAATVEQLGLSLEIQSLATEAQGLVLVAGSRASGKSTLLSALVDLVNRQRAEFVITLERQVRLVHDNKSALVSQREIRGGADESVSAVRAALRENPDVLIVDDPVSPQMVPLLLNAASQGLLVLVSITAPTTTDAVQRFVELAPPDMRQAVQNAMAESFRGAVAQVLLKKAGGGLIAAREVLLATAPVTRVISEGHLEQLAPALESGRKHGMVSFTDVLVDHVRGGIVDLREAFRKAPDRSRLLDSLKREGIDSSVVERLA